MNLHHLFIILVHRSRPVAVVEATTTFDPESKLVSLDDKRCALRDGKKVTCTVINSCLKYNGVNLPIGIGKPPFGYRGLVSSELNAQRISISIRYRCVMDCRCEEVT